MDIKRRASTRISSKNKDDKIKPLFDIVTLDYYCRYIISSNQNIRVSGLNLVKELFEKVDPSFYGNDLERTTRIEFIKRGLEARLVKKLTDRDLIIKYINGGVLDAPLLDTSNMEEISDETLAYLNEQAGELAKSYFVDDNYEKILNLATNLKSENYTRRSDIVKQIQELTSELNLKFNKMDDAVNASPMFTLVPGDFEIALNDTYSRETSPSRILKTGITGLNIMLDGGFQANRVYLLLAQAAGGKSFTMIDLAMQIKKYNKDYKPHDPTKIPTIVFLTMENSQDENVSRMMSMMSGRTFGDCSFDESVDIFRNNGLGYSEDDPIDIIMIYKANLSVNTDYMYTLVDKLREMGREPICFFQDHIKRIRPVNKRNDMRLDLGEIVNEFKAFANEVGIPVITDSHLNRDASRTLDESSSNKKDLIRTLGSFNVSESFLMIDNCDVGIIINKETDSNENLHMGFKCIKTRTKCELDLFYQPYIQNNTIKLVEDINTVMPAYRRALKEENMMSDNSCARVSRRNDFVDSESIRKFEDEDMFSESTMGGVLSRSVDDILLPDNNNQSMFMISGQPSEPIFPIQPPPIQNPLEYTDELDSWTQELIRAKYNTDYKPAIVYLDDDGMVINDGVEDLTLN